MKLVVFCAQSLEEAQELVYPCYEDADIIEWRGQIFWPKDDI